MFEKPKAVFDKKRGRSKFLAPLDKESYVVSFSALKALKFQRKALLCLPFLCILSTVLAAACNPQLGSWAYITHVNSTLANSTDVADVTNITDLGSICGKTVIKAINGIGHFNSSRLSLVLLKTGTLNQYSVIFQQDSHIYEEDGLYRTVEMPHELSVFPNSMRPLYTTNLNTNATYYAHFRVLYNDTNASAVTVAAIYEMNRSTLNVHAPSFGIGNYTVCVTTTWGGGTTYCNSTATGGFMDVTGVAWAPQYYASANLYKVSSTGDTIQYYYYYAPVVAQTNRSMFHPAESQDMHYQVIFGKGNNNCGLIQGYNGSCTFYSPDGANLSACSQSSYSVGHSEAAPLARITAWSQDNTTWVDASETGVLIDASDVILHVGLLPNATDTATWLIRLHTSLSNVSGVTLTSEAITALLNSFLYSYYPDVNYSEVSCSGLFCGLSFLNSGDSPSWTWWITGEYLRETNCKGDWSGALFIPMNTTHVYQFFHRCNGYAGEKHIWSNYYGIIPLALLNGTPMQQAFNGSDIFLMYRSSMGENSGWVYNGTTYYYGSSGYFTIADLATSLSEYVYDRQWSVSDCSYNMSQSLNVTYSCNDDLGNYYTGIVTPLAPVYAYAAESATNVTFDFSGFAYSGDNDYTCYLGSRQVSPSYGRCVFTGVPFNATQTFIMRDRRTGEQSSYIFQTDGEFNEEGYGTGGSCSAFDGYYFIVPAMAKPLTITVLLNRTDGYPIPGANVAFAGSNALTDAKGAAVFTGIYLLDTLTYPIAFTRNGQTINETLTYMRGKLEYPYVIDFGAYPAFTSGTGPSILDAVAAIFTVGNLVVALTLIFCGSVAVIAGPQLGVLTFLIMLGLLTSAGFLPSPIFILVIVGVVALAAVTFKKTGTGEATA